LSNHKEIHSQVLQQALNDLDLAFQNFLRGLKEKIKIGYPRFKCRGIRDSFRYPQGVKIADSKVYLPKIGYVRFIESRNVDGVIKQTTVLKEGKFWYVSYWKL
jgi:putative transposase